MSLFEHDRILALDLGASKIVLAEFRVTKRGDVELLNYGISRTGTETKGESDKQAYIVSAIQEIMRENGIRPAPMMMSISGQSVFPRFVKLPPVSQDKIKQIVQYEAEQNVPFPIDEVVWDYQLIGGDEGEMNVMLVAVKTEAVQRMTDCVQQAGLEPDVVDVAPMALYNTVCYNYPEREGCTMVLDMGARSSNLIFIDENRIFSRSIPVAGNTITQELMKAFNVGFDEAEEIKREEGLVAFGGVYAGPENEVAETTSKIIRSVLTRLHAEINRSINFYRSQQGGSAPELVLLTGGSSVIPYVDTFFRDKLKVEVDYLNPFINIAVSDGIDIEAVNDDLQSLGEVAGLALRRALTCPVEINLMPPALVARKVFRRRLPFFALSAVGVMLTMVCLWVYFHRTGAMLKSSNQAVESELTRFSQLKKLQAVADKREKESIARLDELADLISVRTCWSRIFSTVRDSLDEGMWLVKVEPRTTGREIRKIDITVQGFSDSMLDNDKGTASERFRDRLRKTDMFTEKTDIISEGEVGSYLRRFKVRLMLKKPLAAN